MKICVLGNSQVACLKSAWDSSQARHEDFDLTFFAAFGMWACLQLSGTSLVPTNETLKRNLIYTAGRENVEIPAYDVFLLCGLRLGMNAIDARLSRQVVNALCHDILRKSAAYSLAQKIREVSDAPIYLMPSPLFDERTIRLTRFPVLEYKDYLPLLEDALDVPGAILLRQPDETITAGHYTKLEYSQDAVRLALSAQDEGIQHDDDDYNHMNAKYGAVRLHDFFARLSHKKQEGRAEQIVADCVM